MLQSDTIAAIATYPSNSGIGIIRISGPDAISCCEQIFRSKVPLHEMSTHTISYGFIFDGEEKIDEVLVSLMRAPRSYTMEDVVEIQCHGGIFILQRILSLLFSKGVRPAEAGEFTKRAFLNGRIDLTQAESVMDLISSENEKSRKNSMSQLSGVLSKLLTLNLLWMIRSIFLWMDILRSCLPYWRSCPWSWIPIFVLRMMACY